MRAVRSRRDTRSAVLGYLWCSGGSFRPNLAESVALTEASISRIVAELKTQGVVEETHRTAPYQGGPSIFLTLSKNIPVAALEISSNRLHAAVGSLTGDILYSECLDLPDGLDASGVDAVVTQAIRELAGWTHRRGIVLEQIAVSIPGYHADQRGNPIVALDPAALSRRLEAELPGIPVTLANSIVSRAVAHRLQLGVGHVGGPYFFVFVGHGVGAAFVDEFAESGTVQPCEIGHVVLDPHGGRCRCGHSGCLEAYVSTVALADILNVQEADLIARGDRWVQEFRVSAKARTEIRTRLARLGVAIGNTLNLSRQRRVVVTGWLSVVQEEDRAVVLEAIEQTLLGGAEGVELTFASASLGQEPASGLALATFSFIRRSGERSLPQNTTAVS